MNKSKAKEEAFNPTKTWGEYRDLLDAACTEGKSKVNKSLSRDEVISIFKKMFENKNFNEIPETVSYTHNDKKKLNGDGLGLMNFLREFG